MNGVHYYCTLWLNVLLSSGYQSLCHYVWSTNSWISAESHSPSLLILPIKSIHVPQLKCTAFHSPFLYFFPHKTVIVFQVVAVSCKTAKIHIIVDRLKRRSGASWRIQHRSCLVDERLATDGATSTPLVLNKKRVTARLPSLSFVHSFINSLKYFCHA